MNIGGIVIEPVLDGRILSKLHGTQPFPPADSPLMADQDGMVHPDGLVESTLGGSSSAPRTASCSSTRVAGHRYPAATRRRRSTSTIRVIRSPARYARAVSKRASSPTRSSPTCA